MNPNVAEPSFRLCPGVLADEVMISFEETDNFYTPYVQREFFDPAMKEAEHIVVFLNLLCKYEQCLFSAGDRHRAVLTRAIAVDLCQQ